MSAADDRRTARAQAQARRIEADRYEAEADAETAHQRLNYDSAYGDNSRWVGADVDDVNRELNLTISEYDEWKGVATLKREEALALARFITEHFQ